MALVSFQNPGTKLVLQVSGGSYQGAPVIGQGRNQNGSNQKWIEDIDNSVIRTALDKAFCMDMDHRIIINKYEKGTSSQLWVWRNDKIVNDTINMALQLQGEDNGAIVIAAAKQDIPSQKWKKIASN